MRRFASEQNLFILLSLGIALTMWFYVTVSQNAGTGRLAKTVIVDPNIVGEPANGYSVLGHRVTPQIIAVSGDPKLLEQVQSVTTEPVDISGAAHNVVREVAVVPPASLRAFGRVRVIVEIVPTVGSTIVQGVRVQVLKLPDGLVAQVQPVTVQVQVQGPADVVGRLQARDFSVKVDGTGLAAGRHRIRVDVQGPPQVEVLAVTPEMVVVTVRKGG